MLQWASVGHVFRKKYSILCISRSFGLTELADYWEQVIIMNDHQKRRFALNVIRGLYNTVSGKKIAILGWAFKKDTNDTRESPAMYVADHLLNEQAQIRVYDPKVKEKQIYNDLDYLGSRRADENSRAVEVFADPYQACEDTHAIAILTEWDEFSGYDWDRIYKKMLKPAKIFDGRNVLDVKKLESIGFIVKSVGK